MSVPEDPIPPQYVPEGHHRTGGANMIIPNDDVLPPQHHTSPVHDMPEVDAPELTGAEDDPTKLGEAQASSIISSAGEEFGYELERVRATPRESPSHEPNRSIDFGKVGNEKNMQPAPNSPFPITTSEPACTPASRPIYHDAIKQLKLIKNWPKVCIEGSEDEPPAYMDVQRSDQKIQLLERKRRFDCICESVRHLYIGKLDAEDHEASPRFQGRWNDLIETILDGMLTIILDLPANLGTSVHGYYLGQYRSQVVAGRELVEQEIGSLWSGTLSKALQDEGKTTWILDQGAQFVQYLERNKIHLNEYSRNEADKLLRCAIRDVLLRVFVKYRVEALIELCPREYALDEWLHHQMEVCDEWFEENDCHLEKLPGLKKQLKAVWVFSLWQRWESFLMNGFDPVLAEIWEPSLLAVLLVKQPESVQDLHVGAYPRETLLEGNDCISPHWIRFSCEVDCGVSEGYPIADYHVDILATYINGTQHMVAVSEEGYVFAHIPPSYREGGEKSQIRMKDLVAELLPIWDKRESIVTWLNRARKEERLDTSTIEWINASL